MDTLNRVSEYLFGPAIPHREPCGRAVQIMSDLHLELNRQYATFDFPVKAPFLILGGDIGRLVDYDMFLPFLARQTERFEKVFLVLGNHEFYEMSYEDGIEKARELEKEESLKGKLVILDRNRWDDPDSKLTIIGATLWSNIHSSAAETIALRVSDYKLIKDWTVAKHNECHARDLAYLTETISELNNLPAESQRNVLVVTHHAPCVKGSSRPEHANAPYKTAFSTDVIQAREFMRGVQVWMFGHTHYTTEFKKGGVKVVANQRGYVLGYKGPTLENTKGFDDERVVEL
ncbi:Ser Thr phosphatase superfamily protein [Fusarium denticulatum]|uniref:Ser Thr phosphatase superfamily protein n=1 Tax=Fusarium denticulatum TaxID=48507 RepID=A0A8H6CV93_9HYPO|nr:Ser Thr phosphatase superfamily protein [Fusarium denticulatum]